MNYKFYFNIRIIIVDQKKEKKYYLEKMKSCWRNQELNLEIQIKV